MMRNATIIIKLKKLNIVFINSTAIKLLEVQKRYNETADIVANMAAIIFALSILTNRDENITANALPMPEKLTIRLNMDGFILSTSVTNASWPALIMPDVIANNNDNANQYR
jgi:hypothetical protein